MAHQTDNEASESCLDRTLPAEALLKFRSMPLRCRTVHSAERSSDTSFHGFQWLHMYHHQCPPAFSSASVIEEYFEAMSLTTSTGIQATDFNKYPLTNVLCACTRGIIGLQLHIERHVLSSVQELFVRCEQTVLLPCQFQLLRRFQIDCADKARRPALFVPKLRLKKCWHNN